MKNLISALCFLFVFIANSPAFGAFSPIGLSFTHKGEATQFPHESWNVYGIRFNVLSARHKQVVGLDIGSLSETSELLAGSQMSIFNLNEKRTFILGFQFGAIANNNQGPTSGLGLQMSLLANYNKGPGHFIGVQVAGVNVSYNNVYGVQMGLYNRANRIVGMQFGIMNYCGNLHGIQLGLLNVCKSCLIEIMPGINIGFF